MLLATLALTGRNSSTHDANSVTHYWDCCKASCGWDGGQGSDKIAYGSICDQTGKKMGKAGVLPLVPNGIFLSRPPRASPTSL